jgi:hypothetical protein
MRFLWLICALWALLLLLSSALDAIVYGTTWRAMPALVITGLVIWTYPKFRQAWRENRD